MLRSDRSHPSPSAGQPAEPGTAPVDVDRQRDELAELVGELLAWHWLGQRALPQEDSAEDAEAIH